MPIGKMTRIKDFLLPPNELVIPEETVKVTLSLKKSSVKHQVEQYHVKYPKMIRDLLDKYAMQYTSS